MLNGKGKGAGHQGRPHALVFAWRYSAGKDEPFGAATDGPEQGTALDLARFGRINHLLAQLGSAGRPIPKRFALHLGPCLSFLRKFPGARAFYTPARFTLSAA